MTGLATEPRNDSPFTPVSDYPVYARATAKAMGEKGKGLRTDANDGLLIQVAGGIRVTRFARELHVRPADSKWKENCNDSP